MAQGPPMLSSSTDGGGIAERSSPAAFGYHKHISLREASEEASEEVSVTKKGTRIHHPKRGLGTVVETLNDGRSKCAPRRRRDAAATHAADATHRPSRCGGSLAREILACSRTPARQTLACSACCHTPARACPTSMHMACCCRVRRTRVPHIHAHGVLLPRSPHARAPHPCTWRAAAAVFRRRVVFDSGETHKYQASSLHKIAARSDAVLFYYTRPPAPAPARPPHPLPHPLPTPPLPPAHHAHGPLHK